MIPSFEMKCLPCALCKSGTDVFPAGAHACPAHCKAHMADIKKLEKRVASGVLSRNSPEYQAVHRMKVQGLRWEHELAREKAKESSEMSTMVVIVIVALVCAAVAIVMLISYRSSMKGLIDSAVNSIVEEREKRNMRQQSQSVELSSLTAEEDEDLDNIEDYNVSGAVSD
jgi:hypothetical protein